MKQYNLKPPYHFLIVDMRSFSFSFQLMKNNMEDYFNFLSIILDKRNTIHNDLIFNNKNICEEAYSNIYLIFTSNDGFYRYEEYKKIGFEYHINDFDCHNLIKNNIKEIIHKENLFNMFKIIDVDGYEIKDIVLSISNIILKYCDKNHYDVRLDLLTTNKSLVVSKNYFYNKNFYFHRYLKSLSYSGFEEVENINKYYLNNFGIDFNNDKYNLINKSPIFYEQVLNDLNVLCGIDNCENKIKLINSIGLKTAANFLNKNISLEHYLFSDGFDKKIKKNEDVLKKMIFLSKVNLSNLNLGKDVVFHYYK